MMDPKLEVDNAYKHHHSIDFTLSSVPGWGKDSVKNGTLLNESVT